MTDPTLRADLIAFLENSKGRVRLSTPDYVPMCSAVLPSGERCGADRDLTTQRYCKECRRTYAEKYRENHGPKTIFQVLFHTEAVEAGLVLLRDAA